MGKHTTDTHSERLDEFSRPRPRTELHHTHAAAHHPAAKGAATQDRMALLDSAADGSGIMKSDRLMSLSDAQFLEWLAIRMVTVYRENPDVDFIHRIKDIAASIRKQRSK